MKTKVLQLLVLFLVFGIAQEAKAQWKGTWRTNEGNIQINGSSGKISFGLLDYTFSGTTSNVMNNVLTGTYFVKPSMPKPNEPAPMKSIESGKFGERGTFTLTLDRTGQKFSGEWKNDANPDQKGPLNGTFVHTVRKDKVEELKDMEGAQRKADLENRKVDISGANLKAAVPWVGTWTSNNIKWKIVQSSSTEIRGKRSFTNKDGHVIESDFTASQTVISDNGKTIHYRGTCTDRNRTTNKTVSVPMTLETSSKNTYTTIRVHLDYTNRKNKPAIHVSENYILERISHDVPNMNTYN